MLYFFPIITKEGIESSGNKYGYCLALTSKILHISCMLRKSCVYSLPRIHTVPDDSLTFEFTKTGILLKVRKQTIEAVADLAQETYSAFAVDIPQEISPP